jgi:hypothetical protein
LSTRAKKGAGGQGEWRAYPERMRMGTSL